MHRENFSYTKQSGYYEIYPEGNYTGLAFLPPNSLQVKAFDNELCKRDTTKIRLESGIKDYKLSTARGDSQTISVEYNRPENVANRGMAAIAITNGPLILNEKLLEVKKWAAKNDMSSEKELQDIKMLLSDSIKIVGNESGEKKIEKIGLYLGYRLRNSPGTPVDSMMSKSPLELYRSALQGAKMWCGMYGDIFTAFATTAGIDTRTIEISKHYKDIPGDVHVFNECYLPEQKKWVAVDLFYNNIYIKAKSGSLLNSVEIKKAQTNDSTIIAYKATLKDTLQQVSVSTLSGDFHNSYGQFKDCRFYLPNADISDAGTIARFANYLSKKPLYELYAEDRITCNNNYYIKLFTCISEGILLTVWFIYWLLTIIMSRRTKSKKVVQSVVL